MSSNFTTIVILGSTASGKTEVAQRLALRLNGEILSADSMQIYRYMDIGTAKLPPSERLVPHWGLDLVDPDESYSVALFQRYAHETLNAIASRGHQPFLVGGSGLYIRAALDDLSFAPGEQDANPIRAKYEAQAQVLGAQGLWDSLAKKDPASAAVIHPHNTRRVIRALEMYDLGESYANRKEAFATRPPLMASFKYGIALEPTLLNERIDRRVDAMMAAGLLEEVSSLLNQGYREALQAKAAIGYRELIDYLAGHLTLPEAIQAIKIATHRLAKRQRTWFRRDETITWIDGSSGDTEAISDAIAKDLAHKKVTNTS